MEAAVGVYAVCHFADTDMSSRGQKQEESMK